MSRGRIRVEGDKRIIGKFLALGERADSPRALRAGADVFEDAMRSQITAAGLIDDRDLIDSITTEMEDDSAVVGPGDAGFHGYFHEFGTAKMRARPWFRPAVDRARRPAADAVTDDLKAQIRQVWGR